MTDKAAAFKLSCRNCRSRKIKCDRVLPCAPCTRSKIECAFPKPLRQKGAASRARNAELSKRLAQLESLVGGLGGPERAALRQATDGAGSSEVGLETPGKTPEEGAALPTPMRTTSGPEDVERRAAHLEIREREPMTKSDGKAYLAADFWANLSGEVRSLAPFRP